MIHAILDSDSHSIRMLLCILFWFKFHAVTFDDFGKFRMKFFCFVLIQLRVISIYISPNIWPNAKKCSFIMVNVYRISKFTWMNECIRCVWFNFISFLIDQLVIGAILCVQLWICVLSFFSNGCACVFDGRKGVIVAEGAQSGGQWINKDR